MFAKTERSCFHYTLGSHKQVDVEQPKMKLFPSKCRWGEDGSSCKRSPNLLKAGLFVLFLLLGGSSRAQMSEQPWLTWEEFVQEYIDDLTAEAEAEGSSVSLSTEQRDKLERLSQEPLQLNLASREELLELPFLDEEQVDSILSFRNMGKGFGNLGELQLVRGIDYFTRRYLSLFLRTDSTTRPRPRTSLPMGEKFLKGRFELESRVDVPLYTRAGYDVEPADRTASNYYVGNALRHVVRLRYSYKKEIAYGLTMEKDSGEPVGKQGFYPYDYLSGFLSLRPNNKPWRLIVGDFEMSGGRGLLFGRTYFDGRNSLITTNAKLTKTDFHAHSSTGETDFFRGGAFAWSGKRVEVLAFASYRKLDARMENDTAQSFLSTGLHRTISEIDRRRTLGCLTAGASLGFYQTRWKISLSGLLSHFDKVVWPQEKYYNYGYFRGQTSGNLSADYAYLHKNFSLRGEVAIDQGGHAATEHALSLTLSPRWKLAAQLRALAPKFQTLYGQALCQNTRTANELGAMVGANFQSNEGRELTAYVDLFEFIRPVYTAKLPHARGVEVFVQAKQRFSQNFTMTLRYKLKSRQRTISGEDLLEYRLTHRMRVAAMWTWERLSFNLQADGSLATRQTGKKSAGGMISSRLTWKPTKAFDLKTFGAVFFTEDYDAALYAYEPQLYLSGAFPSFYYKGFRAVVVGNLRIGKAWLLGLRLSSTHYFHRNEISSGADLIASSWKNDLSLQVRLRL